MKRGFTLIETVVVVAISVVALTALVNLFFIFNSIYGYQHAFMAVAGSAGRAMNALEASVLPASRVLASHDFSGTTHSSATTTLVLELPSINSSGDIVQGASDYVVFYASSTELYRLSLPDEQSARAPGRTLLSGTLYSLSFTYDNADVEQAASVTADLQTRAQFKQQTVQSRLREQMYLRNLQPTP